MSLSEKSIVGKRYVIEKEIGRGGMGVVYIAKDRLTGDKVALKMVTTPASDLNFSHGTLGKLDINLAHEFSVLSSLRHPNIISVLDYGFHNGTPYFTMELLEEPQQLLKSAWDKPENKRLTYVVALLRALTYIHRRNIFHRDLKPDNILVTKDGEIKLLDFGLALNAETAKKVASNMELSGTLAYMAPEVLHGEPVSEASDLYAIGMITYEKFAKRYPFSRHDMMTLISEIVSKEPDFSPLDNVTLPDGASGSLRELVESLLQKDPDSRPNNADQIINKINLLQGSSVPLEEPLAIRNSFLEAAQFVGRETELKQLRNAFWNAVKGAGSAWLIGGESGVGKSRFFDEIWAIALVEGAVVLRGQATQASGSTYQVWQPILRFMSILTALSDEEIAALKEVIPDIETLVESQAPELPPTDDAGRQLRIFNTLTQIISRVEEPVVILIEDAQWISSESMAMLNLFSQIASDNKLLVLANYRTEETPDLPSSLPAMQSMVLEALTQEEIQNLIEAMLGLTGEIDKLAEILGGETEGNAYFLVEIIRALAEDAGYLNRISADNIPDSLLTGGIKAVVERRLERVPDYARKALEHIAIAGRIIDTDLIKQIHADLDLEKLLLDLSNVGIIVMKDNRWQFSHDKIRETIIDNMETSQRKELHKSVAGALEHLYENDPEMASLLAYHWFNVGDEAKELQYLGVAGQVAAKNNAHVEAIRYYNRALEILLKQPESIERTQNELMLCLGLGGALIASRGFASDEVETTFNRAREITKLFGNNEQLLAVLWGLGSYYNVKGDYKNGMDVSNQIRAISEESGNPHLILGAKAQQSATRFWIGEFADVYQDFKNFIDNSDPEKAVGFPTPATDDAEVIVMSYYAYALWLVGYPDKSSKVIQETLRLIDLKESAHTKAYGLGFISWLYQFRNEYKEMEELADKNLAISQENQLFYWLSASMMLKGYSLTVNELFEQGFAMIDQGFGIWQMTGAKVFKPSYFAAMARAYLHAQQFDKAMEKIDVALDAIAETNEGLNTPELHRIKGEIFLAQDNNLEAENQFHKSLEIARKQQSKMFELRTSVSLASHWNSLNRVQEAYDLLHPIFETFSEGFDTPDLIAAKSLLDQLSSKLAD